MWHDCDHNARNQRKSNFLKGKLREVNFSVVFWIFVNKSKRTRRHSTDGAAEQESAIRRVCVGNIPRNCNTHRRRKEKKDFFVHISPCVAGWLACLPGRWWRRSVRPLLVWSWTSAEPVVVELAVRSGQASSPRFSFSSVVKVCASACSLVRGGACLLDLTVLFFFALNTANGNNWPPT